MANKEIFVVYNASTNKVEVKEFGIQILQDVSVDLVDYDEVITSDEIDNYLANGDLIRMIDGSFVSYEEAFQVPNVQTVNLIVSEDSSIFGSTQLDGSLFLAGIGNVATVIIESGFRASNALSESNGSGVTQVMPYTYPDNQLGDWHDWGTTVWDPSGLGSTVEYNDWSIWFGDLNKAIEVSIGFDFSSYPDGVYCTYLGHNSEVPFIDVSTYLDRESNPLKIFFSLMAVRDGLIKNIGNYPDLFSVPPSSRDLFHTTALDFIGLKIRVDSSSALTREWGQYLLEGANVYSLDFKQGIFDGPQNIATFEEILTMQFTESHPVLGVDPSIGFYTDFKLHANRYWDVSTGDFAIAPDEKFIISSIFLSTREELHLVQRGNTVYDNLLDALEAIDEFQNRSADLPQPITELFPLISYFVCKTNVDDLSDPTQLRITLSTDAGGATIEGGATGFGQYASYGDYLPEQSTTSITFINALSLITDSSALASTYRIGWTLSIANSKNTKATSYQVSVDGSVVETVDYYAIAANSYANFSAFQHMALPDGSHNISVDYHAAAGSTAYIRDVRLEFFRAATDEVGGQ